MLDIKLKFNLEKWYKNKFDISLNDKVQYYYIYIERDTHTNTQGVWAKFDSLHKRKRKHNIPSKNKRMSARLWLGDNSSMLPLLASTMASRLLWNPAQAFLTVSLERFLDTSLALMLQVEQLVFLSILKQPS